MIPDVLKNVEFGFCLVRNKCKKPLEEDWPNKPYKYDSPKLQEWISQGNNYGIIGGYGSLIVLDYDNKEVMEKILPLLPKTFTVKTGSGGLHQYYLTDNPMSMKLLDKDKNTLIDIQGMNPDTQKRKQALCPGSTHPNGNKYEVYDNSPIAKICIKNLQIILDSYLDEKYKFKPQYPEDEILKRIRERITVLDLMRHYGYDLTRNPTMCKLGHDSKGKSCFHESNNLWYCHHCNEGGDIFSFVMNHDNTDFISAKAKLAKLAGIILEVKEEVEVKSYLNIDIWDYKNLKNYTDVRTFLIDKILPTKSIIMLCSPPAHFKSMLIMQMCLCVSTGSDFLGLKSEKSAVLVCDMENGLIEIRDRIVKQVKALGIEEDDFPFFVTESSINLKIKVVRQQLLEIIKEKNVKLVIFDTLHRFGNYDENSANDINELYTEVFKPIKESGASVIFLHHTSKKSLEYRGSSDLLGNVDLAFVIKKTGFDSFSLINQKNRFGVAGDQFCGQFVFGGDYIDVVKKESEEDLERKSDLVKSFIIDVLVKHAPAGFKAVDLYNLLCLKYDGFEISLKTVRRQLGLLLDSGVVVKRGFVFCWVGRQVTLEDVR